MRRAAPPGVPPTGSVKTEIATWLSHITERWHESYNGFLEYGTDFGMAYQTPVYAVEGGTVLGATAQYGGGGVVSIEAHPTISEYYQHLSYETVGAGDHVNAGDLIGYSGGQLTAGTCNPSSATYSAGPHLEFGINAPYGGVWHPLPGGNENPVPYLEEIARRAASSPTASDPGRDLVMNGGFNQGASSTPWLTQGGVNVQAVPAGLVTGTNAYEGTGYLATNASSSGAAVYQMVPANIVPGNSYCATVEAVTQGAATGGSGTLELRMYPSSVASSIPLTQLGSGNQWKPFTTCVTATQAASSIDVAIYPTPGSPTIGIDAVDVH